MSELSKRSKLMLNTCHADLQRLVEEVNKECPLAVIEGHRSRARQDELFTKGFSKTKWPISRHNTEPSEAVDIMPLPIDWKDLTRLKEFATVVKRHAIALGIEIEWGGDFRGFFDGPHWQLKKK